MIVEEMDDSRRSVRGGASRPTGARMALVASLPGVIMLVVGFVVAVLIGVRTIGVWPTVILWCSLLGVFGAGLLVIVRLMKKR